MNHLLITLVLLAAPGEKPLLASGELSAGTGGVRAEVRDGSGVPVAGVEIRFRSADGRRWTVTTDPQGRFRAGGLPPGDCEMSAHRPGWSGEVRHIRIQAGAWLLGVEVPGAPMRRTGGKALRFAGPATYEADPGAVKLPPRPALEKIPMH